MKTFTEANVISALDQEWRRTLDDFKRHDIDMSEAFAARLALCRVADLLGITDAYIAAAIRPEREKRQEVRS